MPKKVRELKRLVSKAGFVLKPGRGKGSHSYWLHPLLPREPITIPGKDGSDAKPYLEKEVKRLLDKLKAMEDEQ